MCTAKVLGARPSCPWPVVDSADSSLCARHLLIAANDVAQISAPLLASMVRKEQAEVSANGAILGATSAAARATDETNKETRS